MSHHYPSHQPPPRPPLRPEDERTWSILLHLSPIVGLALWAPLVVWLVLRGRGPFLDHHAKEALNFHITTVIASIGAGVLAAVTMGIAMPLIFLVLLAMLVLGIVAAIAASRGEWYRYPLTFRFVS